MTKDPVVILRNPLCELHTISLLVSILFRMKNLVSMTLLSGVSASGLYQSLPMLVTSARLSRRKRAPDNEVCHESYIQHLASLPIPQAQISAEQFRVYLLSDFDLTDRHGDTILSLLRQKPRYPKIKREYEASRAVAVRISKALASTLKAHAALEPTPDIVKSYEAVRDACTAYSAAYGEWSNGRPPVTLSKRLSSLSEKRSETFSAFLSELHVLGAAALLNFIEKRQGRQQVNLLVSLFKFVVHEWHDRIEMLLTLVSVAKRFKGIPSDYAVFSEPSSFYLLHYRRGLAFSALSSLTQLLGSSVTGAEFLLSLNSAEKEFRRVCVDGGSREEFKRLWISGMETMRDFQVLVFEVRDKLSKL